MKVEGPGWLRSRQGGFLCDFSGRLHVLCWPECRMKETVLSSWLEKNHRKVKCFDILTNLATRTASQKMVQILQVPAIYPVRMVDGFPLTLTKPCFCW